MPALLTELFQALAAWPVAAYFRNSTAGYAALNAAHIFSIGLLIGSIATLDLRLLGLFRKVPVAALAEPLSRTAAAGIVLAAATGFLLFSVRPATYAANPAFLAKLALVAIGVLNALFLRTRNDWRVAAENGRIAGAVRATALLSLAIWAGAVLAGRWIGFLQ
jgi:hypothetical protein